VNAHRFAGRDGLRLTLTRKGGVYLVSISRDGDRREEPYSNREDAWERINALRGES
jgi:hypothetical protein